MPARLPGGRAGWELEVAGGMAGRLLRPFVDFLFRSKKRLCVGWVIRAVKTLLEQQPKWFRRLDLAVGHFVVWAAVDNDVVRGDGEGRF